MKIVSSINIPNTNSKKEKLQINIYKIMLVKQFFECIAGRYFKIIPGKVELFCCHCSVIGWRGVAASKETITTVNLFPIDMIN